MNHTPKFYRPAKKKSVKKTHITKKEYRKTSAKSIDSSLNDFFKGRA